MQINIHARKHVQGSYIQASWVPTPERLAVRSLLCSSPATYRFPAHLEIVPECAHCMPWPLVPPLLVLRGALRCQRDRNGRRQAQSPATQACSRQIPAISQSLITYYCHCCSQHGPRGRRGRGCWRRKTQQAGYSLEKRHLEEKEKGNWKLRKGPMTAESNKGIDSKCLRPRTVRARDLVCRSSTLNRGVIDLSHSTWTPIASLTPLECSFIFCHARQKPRETCSFGSGDFPYINRRCSRHWCRRN